MEDKFLLSDDELDNVVGGIAEEKDVREALNTAAQRFEELKTETYARYNVIVEMMANECKKASRDNMSELTAGSLIKRLEAIYATLVNNDEFQVADKARTIIDDLKSSIGV